MSEYKKKIIELIESNLTGYEISKEKLYEYANKVL